MICPLRICFGVHRVEAPVEHDGRGGVLERVEVLGVHLVWEHPLVHVGQVRARDLTRNAGIKLLLRTKLIIAQHHLVQNDRIDGPTACVR